MTTVPAPHNHVTISAIDGTPILTYAPNPRWIVVPVTMPREVIAALADFLHDGAPCGVGSDHLETTQEAEHAFRLRGQIRLIPGRQLAANHWTYVDSPTTVLIFDHYRDYTAEV